MSSLYIHIPFCQSKCLYCSFTSYPNQLKNHGRYVDALLQELRQKATDQPVSKLMTVFIGGGTPTYLSFEDLRRIIITVHQNFNLDESVEFSIEANPESVSRKLLEGLRNLGVNRVSFGVQAFDDKLLLSLGRIHTSTQAEKAVCWACNSGFSNINIDLMYGLPGQTIKLHRLNLEKAFELPITHLSVYELTVEKNTSFVKKLQKGQLDLPSEEEVEAMDEVTSQLSKRAGFTRYEISNYARQGCRCKHNITYWKNREYIGVGLSAVSYLNGKRIKNDSELIEYCKQIETDGVPVVELEKLGWEKSLRESVIMGLRLIDGVERKEICRRYGVDLIEFYGDTVAKLQESGMLDWDEKRLFLTQKGLRYANRVMVELV